MIKIMIRKSTGLRVVYDTVTRKSEDVPNNDDLELKKILKKFKNNEQRRWKNEILSEITGTSARAAREDMGL